MDMSAGISTTSISRSVPCACTTSPPLTCGCCLQGRLFLENTRPKNIATCLKSAKFLRFFFSQLRPNDRDSSATEAQTELESVLQPYPYRSPCGKEMNFIKCADKPFVFDDLRREESDEDGGEEGRWLLSYGGGELSVPFAPDRLRISLSTGRLYHELQTKHMTLSNGHGLALIRSQLAVIFGNTITLHDDDQDPGNEDEDRIIGDFDWDGQLYPVRAVR